MGNSQSAPASATPRPPSRAESTTSTITATDTPTIPNVILFGSTGCGKSSIVNMIANRSIATTSSGAAGCTFQSAKYECEIGGSVFNIFDTAGLDEGGEGSVPNDEAIVQLYKLMRDLDGGISLLVYCMRAPRMADSAQRNWKLFHEIFGKSQVPTVIIITNLEHEEPMEKWWVENKSQFQKNNMRYSGFACITATMGKGTRDGKGYHFQAEYAESQAKVWKLIQQNYLDVPWKMERIGWFKAVIKYLVSTFSWGRGADDAIQKLVSRCWITDLQAAELRTELLSGKNIPA